MGTHLGLKRSRNEDRVAALRVLALNGEIYTAAIVCDGVGGSESGDRAATLAIASIILELSSLRAKQALKETVARLVRCADDFVRHELEGRGTTTLSIFIATSAGQFACANVGDSRVYAWDAHSVLEQVTTDDTVENELKALPGDHQGLLNAKGLKGRLSQALGESGRTSDELRVQVFTRERFTAGVVLGSDGLWKFAGDFDSVVLNAGGALDAVRRSINLANWVGGLDNASILVIDDIEKFCRPVGSPKRFSDGADLSLWTGRSRFRLIGSSRNQWTSSFKQEKSRRKTQKPKQVEAKESESQLALPSTENPVKDTKPLIEVTLGTRPGRE